MLPRGVDDHALRQEALQVQAHMGLGGGFAATVLGPIQGVGHQFNHSGVHDVDRHLEPVSAAPGFAANELRREPAQTIEHLPEKFFPYFSRADFVGVREAVAARRHGASNATQGAAVKL